VSQEFSIFILGFFTILSHHDIYNVKIEVNTLKVFLNFGFYLVMVIILAGPEFT